LICIEEQLFNVSVQETQNQQQQNTVKAIVANRTAVEKTRNQTGKIGRFTETQPRTCVNYIVLALLIDEEYPDC
jgi:hypothetical protein